MLGPLEQLLRDPRPQDAALLDVYSESGRGLCLISLSSDDFCVSKRPRGGSQTRAVVSLYRRPFRRMPPPVR